MENQIVNPGGESELKQPVAGQPPAGAPVEESFKELFENSPQSNIREGEIVAGQVVAVAKDHVVVDIGYKSEGAVPISEFEDGHNQKVDVKVGDKVNVLIESIEDDEGIMVLSKEKADKMVIWDQIADACENDKEVEGVILGRVKGGLAVDIGVKAFLPGSQVDLRPVRNLDRMINETFKFKVIKFNRKRGNIVLSRRALLEKEREQMKRETLKRLRVGAVVDGIVKNLTDYGVFVDLGGIDGLLHITDMSWGRINHPSQKFNVGDEIKCRVLKFDAESERVSLGLKQMQEDPWKDIERKHPIGSRVTGKVGNLADYGAFVEIEEGVEGLVHVTEMSWTRKVKHPAKLVSVGETIEAVVLDIDSQNRRISLGMKQIEPNPWDELARRYPIGSIVTGKVRNITDFGVFVGIEEGIDGLVHISDLSWTHRVEHPAELYKKGDTVETVVLNIDPENERFSLGIKQLQEDPWMKLPVKYPVGGKVKGRVVKITDFGAFVELEPGIEGLVHVSEISEERIESPASVLKVDDVVETRVIHIDPADRRIALSIKALKMSEEEEDYRQYLSQQGEAATQLGDFLRRKMPELSPESSADRGRGRREK